MGSSNNWRSFCVRLNRLRPEFRFILIDLRNHGRSPASSSKNTIRGCAEDLIDLSTEVGEPDILIGHSFSGKVVLDYAGLANPEQVWALDSPPGASMKGHLSSEVQQILSALWEVPMPLDDRFGLKKILVDKGFKTSVAEWMITNLRPHQGGFIWRFHLPGIEEMIADYYKRDMWPIVERINNPVDVRIVRASKSDRWSTSELNNFNKLNGSGRAHLLEKAGHWLHVDNMPGLQMMLMKNLSEI